MQHDALTTTRENTMDTFFKASKIIFDRSVAHWYHVDHVEFDDIHRFSVHKVVVDLGISDYQYGEDKATDELLEGSLKVMKKTLEILNKRWPVIKIEHFTIAQNTRLYLHVKGELRHSIEILESCLMEEKELECA